MTRQETNEMRSKKVEPFVMLTVKLLKDKKLSDSAKVLYGLLLDRVRFMSSNKLYYTNEELSEIVGKSHDRITAYLKELDEAKYIKVTHAKGFWNNTWMNKRIITLKGKRASIVS